MLKKKTILIAELDLKIAAEIKNYLISLGCEVYPIISRGEDLIEKVILLNPSLIITDINLNGSLDGIEAISRLEETLNISYIFIGSDDDSRLISSYYLHPIGLIRKPDKNKNLADSLSKIKLNENSVAADL
jgi:DNA-binding NarL/FixJ family response regulator